MPGAPFFKQWMIENVLASAVAPDHSEVIDRLDARTDARQQTGCTRWSLGQQDRVTGAVLLDFFPDGLRQLFDEMPLQVLIALKMRECAFLCCIVCRSIVS